RAAGGTLTELDVQRAMIGWFADEGLIMDSPPVVAAEENAGDPHYGPSEKKYRAINANEVVLLDLWGKLPEPGAVYADITWVGFSAPAVPDRYVQAFNAARDGRDAAIALVKDAVAAGRELRGFEVDRACRDVLDKAGFGAQFVHRTGHSLGTEVHGNGVHMDVQEQRGDQRARGRQHPDRSAPAQPRPDRLLRRRRGRRRRPAAPFLRRRRAAGAGAARPQPRAERPQQRGAGPRRRRHGLHR